MPNSERKLAAILFSDIVGYTAAVGTDEEKGIALRRQHDQLFRKLATTFNGEIVDESGDELMLTFPSAVDAVRCAQAVQGALETDPELRLRIGIHVGDISSHEGRIIGEGVNIAARLRPLAAPGGICISERVFDDVRNHPEIHAREMGSRQLKNVDRAVRVYAVEVAGDTQKRGMLAQTLTGNRSRRVFAALAILALMVVGYQLFGVDAQVALFRAGVLQPPAAYEQDVQFTTTSDGVRIAYSSVGEGPPIVLVLGWFTHLEDGFFSPRFNPWTAKLSKRFRVIQYDGRGTGLSDKGVEDMSLEAKLRDLEAVIEANGLERFGLFGVSAGGPTIIAYAAHNPERVTRMAFYGSFANIPEGSEYRSQWLTFPQLVRAGWGSDNPAFISLFTALFLPDGSEFEKRLFNEIQRIATTPEDAARFIDSMLETDVTGLAPRIRAPTLVAHLREDLVVPLEAGRQIASLIPNAKLLLFDGRDHALRYGDPMIPLLMQSYDDFFAADIFSAQ